ncbi:hypothetical protein [Streptomyces sp. TLI_105]|uniref:hypothetical protein n=1 Tax=Streptomyces sp. TLI_105 TaxID=1881019 RepID=UPI0015A65B97|nr:hypothetical protein [Streptomyces sp. TLI_105]
MERGISVDNGAGNVVIGDGNWVGAGGPPVRSAYRERVLISAPSELIDREAELAELAAFGLTGQGCLWWRADAWAGKTALMAWFALHPPQGVRVVPFFVTARWSTQNDVDAYVDVVLEQLAELAGQGMPASLTSATREAHLLGLYALAARACAERGERLVLLVDGLDEDRGVTTGPDAHSIAALLPYDLPVIVSGRLNPPLPPDVPEDHPLRTSATVRILAPSPAARVIRSEAERELKGLRDARGLPRDLLGLLTAAGGGLTADDLVKLTGGDAYEVRDLLRTSAGRTFTRVGDAYLLAHEELQLLAAEILGPRAVDRYRDVVHAWAEEWRSRGWPEDTPAYLLHGWLSSLRAGGDLERMVRCALDGARHDRLLAATGGDLAALTEIEKTEAALIDAGVPDFLQFLRLVIAREELVDRSDSIPPTLPWAWAKLGRYDRAEGLARSIVSDDWRARALVDVALRLHEAGRRGEAGSLLSAALEAATLCDNVRGDERDRALEAVSRGRAHVGLYDEAVESARLVERPWRRAELLCEVSRVWVASGEHERAHALCRAEADTTARALLLATAAAGHAERGDVEQALRLAEEAGPEGEILPWVHIAAVLLRAGDGRAAELLDRVDARVRVSPVLAGVVDTLAEAGEYERATSAAGLFDTPESRGWALCDVVAALVTAGRRDQARTLAEAIEDVEARGSALREVVRGLAADPTADDADGLRAAEELARSIDDDGERERALRTVVEALVEAGEFDRAEALAREGAPFKSLSREPLGVVVEALARSGDLRRARELAPDVPYGNGGFALVRGVVEACSDGGGRPEAVAAAAEVVAEVEGRARADSRAGRLDPFHAALVLAEEGFADLARGLLDGVEDRIARASDLDEDGTVPIGLGIHAASAVEALVRLGEFDRAGALVRRLKALPSTVVAVSTAVGHLSRSGLFAQAEAVADALGDKEREHLWSVLAEGAADHGDPVTAEAYARRVTTAHDRVRAWTAVAVAYARAGDAERAGSCLDEGLSHYEQGPYAFIAVPGTVRAFFELGEEEAGDGLLADVVSGATDTSHWTVSVLLAETVRALVAAGEYDRACDFVRSLPDEDGTLHVWIALVMALAEAGEHARAAAEGRSRGLPGDAAGAGETPFGLGRLVRVVEPASGRVLLARLLRKHCLQDLLKDVLHLEPAAAPFVFEACAPGAAKQA